MRFLTTGVRRQPASHLEKYRTLLAWMASPQPLTAEQAQQRIRRAEECRMICPPLTPSARETLAAGCAADDLRPPDEQERLLLAEMVRLLTAAGCWLARPRSLRSGL